MINANAPLLEMKNIKKDFFGNQVLTDINLTLREGEVLGLVGESGCGKSTLAKVILGLLKPDSGTVTVSGNRPQMVFQDPYGSLNPAKKISWILEEPLRMQKVPKEERKKRVLAMAERVGLSAEHLKRRPHELSGGQRQRLALARALLHDSPVYIFDEATSNIDVESENDIMQAGCHRLHFDDMAYAARELGLAV